MPVAGLTKLRKHQFSRQASAGTKVAATRAYAASGTPSVDLAWTDPEVDSGSIDPTVPPERQIPTLTADLTYPGISYNTMTKIMSGFFGGGVSPTGTTTKTWIHDPSSTTAEDFDNYTYEFGDDVLSDWYQLGDGVIDSFEVSGPEGLGPLEGTASWRFGSVASTGSTDSPVTGTVPTPALSPDITDQKIFLKDGSIEIASTYAGLTGSIITKALYSFSLKGSGGVDEKRWADGDHSWDVDETVRTDRLIELTCTFAKTSDIVGTGSESDAWMSDNAVNRYVRLTFISTAEIVAGTPYSWTVVFPLRYYTREEGEVGGNTAVILTGHAFYDPTAPFSGVFRSTLVNSLSEAQLGVA